MKQVRFIAAARREFLAETAYYNEVQDGLGARFVLAVEDAVNRALAFPFSGSPVAGKTRRVVLKDFPFSIFYHVENSGIVIFAVANHARHPDYWKNRIG